MANRRSRTGDLKGDRRANPRYPIVADLDYLLVRSRRKRRHGSGAMINISSAGILFESLQRIEAGEPIEVSIVWPVPAGRHPDIRLRMAGRTVWSQDNRTAVVVEQSTFVTLE